VALYGILRAVDGALSRLARLIRKSAGAVESFILALRSLIVGLLSEFELRRVLNAVEASPHGFVEAEYLSVDELVEALRLRGFTEAESRDIGVGFESRFIHLGMRREVYVVWRCKAVCRLLVEWRPLESSVQRR